MARGAGRWLAVAAAFLVLLPMASRLPSAQAAVSADRYEPNDSRSEAYMLGLDANADWTVADVTMDANDYATGSDYFKWQAPANGTMTVTTTPVSGTRIQFDIENSSGTNLLHRDPGTPGQSVSGSISVTAGTTYYVATHGHSTSGAPGVYHLEADFAPGAAWYDHEDTNDTRAGTPQYPFNTIQEGVSASDDDGTVKLARGTYFGHLTNSGKSVALEGGYPGRSSYPGTGDFSEATRDPAGNPTVLDGGGAPVQVACQHAAAQGSTLDGLTIRNGGATFRGGVVLKQVRAGSN